MRGRCSNKLLFFFLCSQKNTAELHQLLPVETRIGDINESWVHSVWWRNKKHILDCHIHLISHPSMWLELVLAAIVWEIGYTLDGFPVHHRAPQRQICMLTLTHSVNSGVFGHLGGSCSAQREPTHTQGEHVNSSQDLNQDPSCCEVTVLTTTPPCGSYISSVWFNQFTVRGWLLTRLKRKNTASVVSASQDSKIAVNWSNIMCPSLLVSGTSHKLYVFKIMHR